ncbi:MAG: SusC/RagA family TonB-linked outer membrane protein [Bacteroidales bacterium]|nr:MAG: SusC/RagA family TonB-linked outer membrane protein [Bacteroidales bacterium]
MLVMLFAFTNVLYAQRDITGVVKDAKDGVVLPGVNVMVKGTSVGSTTNVDGKYSVKVPSGSTILVFSFIGYNSKEITLIDAQDSYDVMLETSTQEIEELVVTALGVKREKKALGYSMEEIKGEGLTETRDPNVSNALTGKIAGLQVRQASSGPSGSSRITIRGNNSISSNNQPLLVVDGMPVSSSTSGTDDYWGNRNVDKGSGMADISPDDIESMSILKGPAASALYGSLAGNGVIMITTKSGKLKKGLGISFNTNTTFEKPMETPDFQNVYGQGINGAFDVTQTGSWGSAMDGSNVAALLGDKPYSSSGNNLYEDFLRTGVTSTNSLELTAGNDNSTLRIGISRMDNKGIVPNSKFEKTSFDVRTTGKWNKLSADVKINYIRQITENRIKLAGDPDNIFLNYLATPRSVAFSDYDKYKEFNYAKEKYGSPAVFEANTFNNPYWSAYRNTNKDNKDRMLGFFALQYDFTSWLNLKARYGLDYTSSMFQDRLATGTPYWTTNGITGDFRAIQEINKIQNADFLFTAQSKLFDKVKGIFTFGGNLMNSKSTYQLTQAQGLEIPDYYSVLNGVNREIAFNRTEEEIRSWYGTASLSYDNWAYLDVTARQDRSSTLDGDSYFYPSIGGSIIVSQLLENSGIKTGPISFAKIRASWAEVGNDTDPYRTREYLNIKYDDGVLNVTPENFKTNPNYKPESIKSSEFGVDFRMFQNRLGIDFTYYKKNAFNQIIKLPTPPATGFQYEYVNAGNVENKGIELSVNAIPIHKKNLDWNISLNFSKNKNKIIKLTDGVKDHLLSDLSVQFLQVVASEGGDYGDILGYTYDRNADGQIYVDANGIPLPSEKMSKLGNYQPKWMMGLYNNITIYGINLGFLVDLRYGGKVYMGSIRTGATSGTLAMTLDGRETGFVVPNSIVKSTGEENSKAVSSQDYWKGISGITEAWMYDATNICLREMSIGYAIPTAITQKVKLSSVKVSLVARNLFMIYSKTKGFNPEGTYSTNNAQGIEYGTMPQLRSIGFNINLTF